MFKIFKKRSKKFEKGNHHISIFGHSVYTDWYIILIISILFIVAASIHSYKTYEEVRNSEVSTEEKSLESQIDLDKLDKVLSKYN